MAAKKQPEPEIVEVIAQESKPQESETLKSEPLLDLESTVTIDDALPKTDSTKGEYLSMPVDDLVLDAANPRKGNVREIKASLQEFGQHRAVVVQRKTNKIIAGNHLVKAARQLGWTHVDCVIVDDDDLKAVRRGLVDNRVGDLGEYDDDILKTLVLEAGGNLPGFDDAFIESLAREAGVKEEKKSEPQYPLAPKFLESYNHIIIYSTNDTDYTFLRTVLELERKKSWKGVNIGVCHVVTAEKFAQLWRARG